MNIKNFIRRRVSKFNFPGQYQIIQIIPANGFMATFSNDLGNTLEYDYAPLVCWGLVDVAAEMPDHSIEIVREIWGFISTSDYGISPVEDMKGFESYETKDIYNDCKVLTLIEQNKGN